MSHIFKITNCVPNDIFSHWQQCRYVILSHTSGIRYPAG